MTIEHDCNRRSYHLRRLGFLRAGDVSTEIDSFRTPFEDAHQKARVCCRPGTEVQRAHDAARHAAAARHEALVEAGRTAQDTARDTTSKALTQDHEDDR